MCKLMHASAIALGVGAFFVSPAFGQRALDARDVKLYGGSYSAKCGNPSAPHLTVNTDALTVEQGKKRLTGRNVSSMASYFGQSGPPNFLTALLADVRPNVAVTFLVYRDKAGQYITLDGHPKVVAVLGKGLTSLKYRRCSPPS